MAPNEDHPATRGAFISRRRSPNCRVTARFNVDGLFSEEDSKRRSRARAYFRSSSANDLSLSLSLSLKLPSLVLSAYESARAQNLIHSVRDDGIEINRRGIARRC